MKKFKISQFKNLVIATVVSISSLLLIWLTSPLLPSLAKPQTQVFEQVWQTVNANFYDPKFNQVDWKAVRTKYQIPAAQAQNSEEFAAVINQMLSELRASHTHFYTQNEPAYYQLLGIFQPRSEELQQQLKKFLPTGIEYSGIGIFTKDINGNTFISAILDGSPAIKAGLKVGDQILSADNRPFHPIQSFLATGKKVKLSIQRTADSNSKEIAVTPKMLDATTMFLDAQASSVQVIERQGKKIGYIHIWSYAGDRYQQQLEDELLYGRLKNADALVLDLREGWGGASPNYLNIYTATGPSVTNIGRDRQQDRTNYQWKKPVVMVVNERSRSGKEILAYGFQKYKIGSVVGSKTAGAVLAGRPFVMQDGSALYLAVADVLIDDNQRLEGKGIIPDINVPFSLEYAQGIDPQKERAVEVARSAVKS